MLAWIVIGWIGLNYVFAAQLVYLAARRNRASRREALARAATWPFTMLSGEHVRD